MSNEPVSAKRSIEEDQTSKSDKDEVTTSKKQKMDKLDKVESFKKPNLAEFTKFKEEINNTSDESKPKMEKIEKKEKIEPTIKQEVTEVIEQAQSTPNVLGTNLPEGFFDDPDLDAKVRGVSRAENLEAEFEEFKKQIQTEELKSEVLIEKDDVLRDISRDLDEVDELINRWTKIEHLHQKREEMIRIKQSKMETTEAKNSNEKSDESSDDSDVDLDNVLNLTLRSKKRY